MIDGIQELVRAVESRLGRLLTGDEVNAIAVNYCERLLASRKIVAGSTEHGEIRGTLELRIMRKLTRAECDRLRKACQAVRPSKGRGKTRTRNAKAFAGQGKAPPKRARVAQLPLEWQCTRGSQSK